MLVYSSVKVFTIEHFINNNNSFYFKEAVHSHIYLRLTERQYRQSIYLSSDIKSLFFYEFNSVRFSKTSLIK